MKKIMKYIIGNLLRCFPLKNIIIFESNSDFCDNSRAIFEYLIQNKYNNKYNMIWLVQKPENFEDKKIKNVKFIQIDSKNIIIKVILCYYTAIAKYAFYSHRTPIFRLNRGEKFINLWHGSGIKNINFCDLGLNFDYVLCSSDFYKEFYIENLGCSENQLLTLGNPRNDLLRKDNFIVYKEFSILENKKIIIWMPTFRKHKNGMENFEGNNKFEMGLPLISSEKELKELDSFLDGKNIMLLIKLHPSAFIEKITAKGLNNILCLTNEELDKKNIQLYSLLEKSDALITDYSSVYTDFLLLNRPIGFIIDDIKKYKTGFFLENPLEIMPGKHIVNIEGVKEFILTIFNSQDEYTKKRTEINNVLNEHKKNFSKRIIKKIGLGE